jgi:hypothetical protein
MVERSTQGHVEVICGPMFSGKTEELIKRLRRAQIARQRVVVFKPKIDDRYDETAVVSHSSLRIESVPVEHSADIERWLAKHGTTPASSASTRPSSSTPASSTSSSASPIAASASSSPASIRTTWAAPSG